MEEGHPQVIHLEGETKCTYAWSTGGTVGAFLEALRDHGKILGAVCGGCGTVAVPPQSYCEQCGAGMKDWKEVGPRGVVVSWARVPSPVEGAPLEAPFRYVLVRLSGADTSILHLAPDDDRVKIGAVVVPEFREDRKGSVTDIRWFVPEDSSLAEDGGKRELGGIAFAREAVAGRGPVTEAHGELDLSFKYSCGEYYDRFYREMRDNKRITGVKCSKCGAVLLPPRPYCGFCFAPVDTWVELSDEGSLVTFTEIHMPFVGQPTEPPYIYAFIMLDGADVHIPHLLGEVALEDVRAGMRVKAVWAKDRKGTLHDIEYFRPLQLGA